MQTFLPYPNFAISAMHLDYRRLGKQRVEARQIQTALQTGGGWSSHPATRMWDGHIEALMLYGDCMIREWVRRGYNNTMPLMCSRDYQDLSFQQRDISMPPWLGDDAFHASHRSALLFKDPEWYGQFGWTDPAEYNYIWPTETT